MVEQDDSVFREFEKLRKKDLRRIASATRGELRLDDVIQEAWLLAHDLRASGKLEADLLDVPTQNLLLSHLYQKLVRYTEQHVRHGVRLDHPSQSEGQGEDEVHPLMKMLVSDDGRSVLDELLEREGSASQSREPGVHHSQASAYLHLLRHFKCRMPRVAKHLLISLSHTYRCCARAAYLANHQHPIPMELTDDAFVPQPWRRFRLIRQPLQMSFDFDDELPLGYLSTSCKSSGLTSSRIGA